MENTYFVSIGNSIGEYSDYFPQNFSSVAEAEAFADEEVPDGNYIIWHSEWDEDQKECVAVYDPASWEETQQ